MWHFKMSISPLSGIDAFPPKGNSILPAAFEDVCTEHSQTRFSFFFFPLFVLKRPGCQGVSDMQLLEFITHAANHEFSRISLQ